MIQVNVKKVIIYSIIAIVFSIIFMPHVSGIIRYKIESVFGDPNSFFYGVGLGIDTDGFQYYEEEYRLDDYLNELTIDPYYLHEGELTIYGRVTNSAEPLKILVNEEVIYDGKMSPGSSDGIWHKYYLETYFAIGLDQLEENKKNEIILISGGAVEKIIINFK